MKKIRVGILFGGKSAEHEISLLSAKSVIEAMDKNKYDIILLAINKFGEWFLHDTLEQCLLHADNPELIQLQNNQQNVTLVAKETGDPLVSLSQKSLSQGLDVIFPVLHGTYGEDGTIQGLLKLVNLPFVGASVLGSAIAMDKDVMKRLFREGGITTAKSLTVTKATAKSLSFQTVKETLGMPVFIKPANLGSSVGVSKVKHAEEFQEKLALAFQYDRKVIIEEYIQGREIECSVLGNEEPVASLPGELIPQHEFYSYEAKYLDKQGALFEIPAKLPEFLIKEIQALSIAAYKTLCCEGMARVDLFLTPENRLYLNEINTIPGFTSISMYPKMWEISGLAYPDLIDKLIQLAFDRFKQEQALKTSFEMPRDSNDPALLAMTNPKVNVQP